MLVAELFPSPCGDVVLKCAGAGAGQESASSVSVPLRGCGFEMPEAFTDDYEEKFPSPCGDVVLKLT